MPVPRLRLIAPLALLGACSTGGPQIPVGFSTAFEVTSSDGGTTPALRAINGTGAGNVWAVGDDGLTISQSGGEFQVAPSPGVTSGLGGLSAFDIHHTFAVEAAGATVFAWSNNQWSPLGATRADRAAAATWAADASDVWVAGNGIEHWDGTTWTLQVSTGTFSALSGSFRTDVWAVGAGGIEHWNGSTWTAIPAPTTAGALTGVWTADQFDTWIVGGKGTVLFWNGATLTQLPTQSTLDLTSVSGTSNNDVWAGATDGTLLHWDGTSWTTRQSTAGKPIIDLWTSPGADVLFVDGSGAVGRYVSP
ncbi:MAG TPA: hypothetical protein VHJ20_17370 [Polyangia bacterium]|nr:hypothetical protein [Polyangia bacterium]